MNRRTRTLAVTALAGGTFIAACAVAGPLSPPAGPITPTNKTLDQVQPRIPISSAVAIFTPGSYYLTGDVFTPAGVDGIRIYTSNVTLDLNGFTIYGGRTGVYLGHSPFSPPCDAVTIINGTISDVAGSGIYSGGLADEPKGTTVRNVKVLGAADLSINVGRGSTVENCYVSGGTTGIKAGFSSRISGCVVEFARTFAYQIGGGSNVFDCVAVGTDDGAGDGTGFAVGAGSTIRGISSRSNAGNGGIFDNECNISDSAFTNNSLTGVILRSNSRLSGCTMSSNYSSGVVLDTVGGGASCIVEHCNISSNVPLGIGSFGAGNHTIRDNTIARNADFGIRVADNCHITNNRIGENGDTNNDGGIFVTGSGNIIQNNNFSLNAGSGVELYTTSSSNFVLANTFRGATVRANGSNQTVAPITAAATAITGSNSFVNISY